MAGGDGELNLFGRQGLIGLQIAASSMTCAIDIFWLDRCSWFGCWGCKAGMDLFNSSGHGTHVERLHPGFCLVLTGELGGAGQLMWRTACRLWTLCPQVVWCLASTSVFLSLSA